MQPGNSVSEKHDCAVIIIGGGPCGLMLAIELGRRGVPVILLEEKTSPARFPAANATQARTMEHYRRLGFAEKVRAQGLPPDYPTDIAYFTRYAKHELARFSLPSARAAREIVRTLTGSWSAAELPHRVSQMFVEDVLRAEADGVPDGVDPAGLADGGRARHRRPASRSMPSMTAAARRCARPMRRRRRRLAARPARRWATAMSAKAAWCATSWAGGCSPSISAAPELYDVIPHPRAWMYWAVNRDRRAFMATVNGRDEFNFHTQLKPGESEQITDAEAKAMFQEALAAPLDIEIIARSAWTAGYTLVAEKFQRGRIFLGGDAAHLFTPAGGLGYNTAVEDAVNLGWKLAAVLKGWGGAALLDSYETERQAIARRNTAYARGFADSLGLFVPPPELEDDGPGRRGGAQAHRRPLQPPRPLRVQHSGHHLRRPLRRLADRRAGRHGAAARRAEQLPAHRLPGRPRAASVARRRPLALRRARLRVHAACARRQARRRRRRSAPPPRR